MHKRRAATDFGSDGGFSGRDLSDWLAIGRRLKRNDVLSPIDRWPIGDISSTGRRPIADQSTFNDQLVPWLS